MDKQCFFCMNKGDLTFLSRPLCLECYNSLCIFCSTTQDLPIGKEMCLGHTFSTSTRNRFMEDNSFVKHGGFDFES